MTGATEVKSSVRDHTVPDDLPCHRCGDPCCQAVKRIPYQGENSSLLFKHILIGAFPDIVDGEASEPRRPFVTEWVIPGEASACPAYTDEGLCRIYDARPRACRSFPRNRDGSLHPRCPMGTLVGGEMVPDPSFLLDLLHLDLHLLHLISEEGEEGMGRFIGEARPFNAPLLYNGYLLALWIIAGVDIAGAINGQRAVLEAYRLQGYQELTFLVPETDYQISGDIEGLLANLRWLELRIREEDLLEDVGRNLALLAGRP
jgi:Fe-S-cluster containining protein